MGLDKSHLEDIEDAIAPPLRHAITIPVIPERDGIVVYVAASAFCDGRGESAQIAAVREIASGLAIVRPVTIAADEDSVFVNAGGETFSFEIPGMLTGAELAKVLEAIGVSVEYQWQGVDHQWQGDEEDDETD